MRPLTVSGLVVCRMEIGAGPVIHERASHTATPIGPHLLQGNQRHVLFDHCSGLRRRHQSQLFRA